MAQMLASLDTIKSWVTEKSNKNDDLLKRLGAMATQFVLNYTQRPSFFRREVTEIRDGLGGQVMILGNWPVASVSAVNIGPRAISAAASLGASGWALEAWNGYPPGYAQEITLNGGVFYCGLQNISFTYLTGFFIADEAVTIPAVDIPVVTVAAPLGSWGQDDGVTLADGTPLAKVDCTPSTGQYSAKAGVYTFSSADSGTPVLISYSYVPTDIEQAVCEIVGERYRYMQRIGQNSNSTAAQITINYSLKSMQDFVREILDRYKQSSYL